MQRGRGGIEAGFGPWCAPHRVRASHVVDGWRVESAAIGYRNSALPRSGYLRLSLVPLSSSTLVSYPLASSSLMRGLVGTRLGRPAARVLPSCWYPSRSRTSDVVWLLGPCVSPPAPPRSSSLVRSLRVPCSWGLSSMLLRHMHVLCTYVGWGAVQRVSV